MNTELKPEIKSVSFDPGNHNSLGIDIRNAHVLFDTFPWNEYPGDCTNITIFGLSEKGLLKLGQACIDAANTLRGLEAK